MSSNTFSFSMSGVSEIIYGAAILTGIYAGVTIIKEFFAYKKEELYVNARLMPPSPTFDIAGDIKYDKPICSRNPNYAQKTNTIVGKPQLQQAQQTQQVQQISQPKNTTKLLPKENNTVAEMIDFDNNTLHVIEEYA